jgi:dihydrofolate synthase/folylpolyglutamate synthase
MPFSYRDALDRLLTLADFERKSRAGEPPDWHLRRMEALLGRLDNPHLAAPVVHVAGSKGKGSTSAMVASMLGAAGYRAGLYISPHLHRFTERIQVGREQVSETAFAGLLARLWPAVDAIGAEGALGRVSVFELLTAMAFVHFRAVGCDAAVIEVGLGGRLDATNLVRPAVSVITPISLDHVKVLGDTLAKIAFEKAGIIKPGAPAVIGRQDAQARRVFETVARERGAALVDALSEVALISQDAPSEGPQKFTLRGRLGQYVVTLPLLGLHQVDNARLAVAAIEQLERCGFSVRPDAIEAGLRDVRWPARAEVVSEGPPLVLADGAHNDASASALVAAVNRHFPERSPLVFLTGGTSGHDFAATARVFAHAGGRFVVTQSRHPRAVPAAEFAAALERQGARVAAVEEDAAGALAVATRLAGGRRGMVVATGSLFIAAEIRELLLGIEPELYPDLKGPLTQPYTAGAAV